MRRNSKEKIKLINKYSFLAIFLSLGYRDIISIYIIGFWILTSIVCLISNSKEYKLQFSPLFYAPILIFIATLGLVFISDDSQFAASYLEQKLLFLIVPLLISFKVYRNTSVEEIFIAILIGFLSSIIFIIIKGIVWTFQEPWYYAQFNLKITEYFYVILASFKHRSYWGIAGIFAFISTVYLVRQEKYGVKKYIYFISLALICLVIYFSQARITLIALVLSVIIMLIKFAWEKKNIIFSILIAISFSLLFLIFYITPRFSTFFSNNIFSDFNKTDSRGYIWQASIKLIKENGLSGVGIENVSDKLKDSYQDLRFTDGVTNKFNAHNQFLQGWLEGGIILFTLYLVAFLFPILLSIIKKKLYPFLFTISLFLFALVESIHNRISGVILYFVCLIVITVFSEQTNYSVIQSNKTKRSYNIGLTSVFTLLISLLFLLFILHKPLDPKRTSTYGVNKHQEVNVYEFGLTKVPIDTKGYLLDSTTNYTTNGLSSYSYTSVLKKINIKKDSITTSVWCYISNDCNADRVGIALGNTKRGYDENHYNLNKKGEWQFLELDKVIEKGTISFVLFMIDDNATSFNNLDGFVIFAYPNYKFY